MALVCDSPQFNDSEVTCLQRSLTVGMAEPWPGEEVVVRPCTDEPFEIKLTTAVLEDLLM